MNPEIDFLFAMELKGPDFQTFLIKTGQDAIMETISQKLYLGSLASCPEYPHWISI